MLYVISVPCVAHDLHTIAPRLLECMCWRQFTAQWGDCQKSRIVLLNAITTTTTTTNTFSCWISMGFTIPTSPPLYLIEVSKWFIISHHHLCELQALVRVDAHDVAQQEDVVWGEAHLLGVQDDLLELACLSKTLDHLWRYKQTDKLKTLLEFVCDPQACDREGERTISNLHLETL